MKGTFRLKPEHVDEALAAFAEIGIEPVSVHSREDRSVAVVVNLQSDNHGQALAKCFKHEWSAIIGIVGGPPFETRH